MGFQDIIDLTETICELDRDRRERFREEFDRFEDGELSTFTGTRRIIERERSNLQALNEELRTEHEEITELADDTEYLSVEQAVEHREESIEKLREHNDHLRTFHEAMQEGISIIEANLRIVENDGPESVTRSPAEHFERAEQALERHNDAVSGLKKNLTIFNAYITGV